MHNNIIDLGYTVFSFTNIEPILIVRDKILSEINLKYLKLYKEFNNSKHITTQDKLTHSIRNNNLCNNIIHKNISLFYKILLSDTIYIQKNPYLRIVRSLTPEDNIGYHKDTFYGGTKVEYSIIIPLVNLDDDSTIRVWPKSHNIKDEDLEYTIEEKPEIEKGSIKHNLGFLYAPKVLNHKYNQFMIPVPLKLGQGLMFNLGLVHGTINNFSSYTRWTCDTRITTDKILNYPDRKSYYNDI